jgi:arylformamidase
MKIIDISWPISTVTTGYKDKKVVTFEATKQFEKDGARETTLCVSSHTGTHIDAPSHFLKDGLTIDALSLDRFIGPCIVIDCTDVSEYIADTALQNKSIKQGDIVLFKTANSLISPTDSFSPHFIYVHHSAARYLAEKKVKAVGIDYLGIERSQSGHPTHTILMHSDVIIIEGLRLQQVNPGNYFFVCLPLYTIGLEAAPARAILMTGIH